MKTLTITLVLCLVAPMAFAKPTTCRSWQGMEVPYLGDSSLNKIGDIYFDKSERPLILLNPEILGEVPPLAAEFWLAHICGHHALTPEYNTEEEADCFAMRSLSKKKIRSDEKREELYEQLRSLQPGELGEHQPDAARIDALRQCELPD